MAQVLARTSASVFASNFSRPFLVGKELYDGEIVQTSTSYTMKFKRSDLVQAHPGQNPAAAAAAMRETALAGIASTIYMLVKKPQFHGLANIVTAGRASENDLVIADYSISQHHCQFIIEYGTYYIVDMESTNGTYVNDEPVVPKQKFKLSWNDMIAFGRIVFVFMSPADLFAGLKH